ncbi:Molecular chaperone HtpG [Mycena sanguinolenta]|uniref:Molecular chaperone HtpG n=1 Tax=Mycena sanguinolenta TaxID=230812 RepID=A0A8H6XJJ6_9AGAR|nr:Molecular chaperone HtpG [Mycena sanguinolenta]KAF7364164.1 Molecular chaperone HtpG [Mycena sanguinolenta]
MERGAQQGEAHLDVQPFGRNPEYGAFHRSFTNHWEDQLAVKHFSFEGQVKLQVLFITACLFLPSLFKVYDCRVFLEDLIPEYLHFVKGIVASEYLPTNMPHETLASKTMARGNLTNFHEFPGKNLKLGIYEDSQNRNLV